VTIVWRRVDQKEKQYGQVASLGTIKALSTYKNQPFCYG